MDGGTADRRTADDASAPLDELAAAVESPRSGSSGDDVWDRFDGPSGPNPARLRAAFWDRSVDRAGGRRGTRPTAGSPETDSFPRFDGWTGRGSSRTIANRTKLGHGSITGLFLAASVAVFASAGLGLVPGHLWIVGIPLLLSGLILLFPILAWHAGVWDPRGIGSDRTP